MARDLERLPLNALKVFEAVATHLSFTAAANELGVTTAAVSAQVKSLEAEIGVALFRRHTRAVALTQEGAELLPGVRRGLDELRRAVDRIRRERVGGLLNLSVPNEFLQRWLLPRMSEFTRRHPEVEVRFGPGRPTLDFSRDDFHVAIVYGSGNWPGIRTERLLDEWVFPVGSPALLERLGPIETVADFARYPLIHSRLGALGGLAAPRGWRHDAARPCARSRGCGRDAGRRRTGQGSGACALVTGGGRPRRRPAGRGRCRSRSISATPGSSRHRPMPSRCPRSCASAPGWASAAELSRRRPAKCGRRPESSGCGPDAGARAPGGGRSRSRGQPRSGPRRHRARPAHGRYAARAARNRRASSAPRRRAVACRAVPMRRAAAEDRRVRCHVEVAADDPAARRTSDLRRDGLENEVASSHELRQQVANACARRRA